MRKTLIFLGLTIGVASLTVGDAFGAGWYPFYGYHRPNYLGGTSYCVPQANYTAPPATVVVEPGMPQAQSTYYPSESGVVAGVQPVVPQYTAPRTYSSGSRWYPFYGYRRPNLGQ